MKTQTKSILIIAAAIFGGILIGALAVGAIVNHRIDQLQQLRRPAGFAEIVEDVIQPESPEQSAQVRRALRNAAERNVALRRSMHRQHIALLDSLQSDLSAILSDEQMDRLEKWVKHQRRPMRFRRDGPPGGGAFGRFGPPGGADGLGGGPPPAGPPEDSMDIPKDRDGDL